MSRGGGTRTPGDVHPKHAPLPLGDTPKYAVRVAVRRVRPGEGANFELPDDWKWPFYAMDRDGDNVLRMDPGRGRFAHLRTFELHAPLRRDLVQRLYDIIRTLARDVAGFAGTAVVLLRSDYWVEGERNERIYVIGLALAYTAALEVSGQQIAGFPDFAYMGPDEETLWAGLIAHEVLGT